VLTASQQLTGDFRHIPEASTLQSNPPMLVECSPMSFGASIVIPLLNQVDDWLEQSVRSAITQTINTEVVVVRSKLTSPSNLRTLARLQQQYTNLSVLLEDKSPHHFPAAINMGIRRATADRVGLVLSDDWIDRTTVAECLVNSTDIVSTGTVSHFTNDRITNGRTNEPVCRTLSMSKFQACETLELKASYLTHFFLFRKQTVLNVGGLDETIGNFPGIDDLDLIWTLLERGATVSVLGKPMYHAREHDGERLTLQDPKRKIENLQKILRKHMVDKQEEIDIIRRHVGWYIRRINMNAADWYQS
jgi:GT2 family glycosyltransferase